MSYEEKMQWSLSVIEDISGALERQRRIHKGYVKRGQLVSAAKTMAEIEVLEEELAREQELFDLMFN